MSVDVFEGQQVSLSVAFTKEDGSPGTVEGLPVWTVSDPAAGELVVAADGLSAVLKHPAGLTADVLATISVSADGDLGAGVMTITATSEPIVFRGVNIGATAAAVSVSVEPIPA